MKCKKIFIVIIIALLFVGIAYYFIPKTGSFNDLIISRFSDKNFTDIYVVNNEVNNECRVDIKNDKINEFITYVSKLKLTQYRGQIPKSNLDYWIYINSRNSNMLRINMTNKNYITIKTSIDNKTKEETYLIKNGGFDLKYIDKLIAQ